MEIQIQITRQLKDWPAEVQAWEENADASPEDGIDVELTLTFEPGWSELASGVESELPGLLIAGDHVIVDRNCAFMERAVYTGRLAANVVLEEQGLAPARILDPA